MNITYGVTEENCFLGTDSRISYGIVAYADTDENGIATITVFVHDVTDDNRLLPSSFHCATAWKELFTSDGGLPHKPTHI